MTVIVLLTVYEEYFIVLAGVAVIIPLIRYPLPLFFVFDFEDLPYMLLGCNCPLHLFFLKM